jgi:hypothetical protein
MQVLPQFVPNLSRIRRYSQQEGTPAMREPLDMATIALVDDDRNILTSVSIAL